MQLQQNNDTSTKPPRDSRSHNAPPIASRKGEEQTATGEPSAHSDVEKVKKRKKEKSAEKLRTQEQKLAEIEPPVSLPPPSHVPSTTDAFRDWYLAKLADTFETEIEGINDADAPVGSKVLLQALESNLTLFSEQEKRVALASEGG